jgi:FkbM family methyltransferase
MLSTATKVRIASLLSSTLLRLGFRQQRRIVRGGVVYEADLREGIDLSLFLFGAFQRQVLQNIRRFLPEDGILVDVGANVGAITLPAAAHLRAGHVYAFEPTDYAYAKLQRNLALNPALAARITVVQSFVADVSASGSQLIAYSSWPVTGTPDTELHPVHKGAAKPASCGQTTLDAFTRDQRLPRLSLIKIDTDGHELTVLNGALETLRRYRPVVVFEACEYLMRDPGRTFDDFARLFAEVGYTIRHGDGLQPMDAAGFGAACPAGGGLDLLAVPDERSKAAQQAAHGSASHFTPRG